MEGVQNNQVYLIRLCERFTMNYCHSTMQFNAVDSMIMQFNAIIGKWKHREDMKYLDGLKASVDLYVFLPNSYSIFAHETQFLGSQLVP